MQSCGHESDEEINVVKKTTLIMWYVSAWCLTVDKINDVRADQQELVYFDYVRNVEQVVLADVFHRCGIKACKYTEKMKLDDRCGPEKSFRERHTSVIVDNESFELGVNNPNISEIIRVGSPRSLSVLLQEFDRAG